VEHLSESALRFLQALSLEERSLRNLFTFLFAVTALLGVARADLTISSPQNGQNVPASVHFVASATSTYNITAMSIYIDGVKKYHVYASQLDTYLTVSSGGHSVSVKAWDASGRLFRKDLTIYSGNVSSSASAITYSRIEEMSGWDSCTTCAGGGRNAVYWMKQGISSPSLDGNATEFFVGGTTPYSHALFWKRLASANTSQHHFVLDMYYLLKDPASSQGLEFETHQTFGGYRYKAPWLCSFDHKLWKVFDPAIGTWSPTTLPCVRPPANTWQHVVFEAERTSDNKVLFVSVTVNGVKTYINKKVIPLKVSSDLSGTGVHFQLDGNKYQTDYHAWIDKMKLTVW
jgi:hypothetical protein